MRGCDDVCPPNTHFAWAPGLDRCPWSQLDGEVWALVEWWRDWEELRVLPFGGSDLGDQPAYVGEAMRICARVAAEVRGHHQALRERAHLEAIKKAVAARGQG